MAFSRKSTAPVVKGSDEIGLPLLSPKLTFAHLAALAASGEVGRYVPLVVEETRVRIPTTVKGTAGDTDTVTGLPEYRVLVSVVREPLTAAEVAASDAFDATQKKRSSERKEQEERNKSALVDGVRKETASLVRDTYSAVQRDLAQLEATKARLAAAGIAVSTGQP